MARHSNHVHKLSKIERMQRDHPEKLAGPTGRDMTRKKYTKNKKVVKKEWGYRPSIGAEPGRPYTPTRLEQRPGFLVTPDAGGS